MHALHEWCSGLVKVTPAAESDLAVPDAIHLCLQPAPVVSKVYEDFKMTQADVLGRPKLLGARKQDLGADHVFGKPSAPKGGEPSAGEVRCMRWFVWKSAHAAS